VFSFLLVFCFSTVIAKREATKQLGFPLREFSTRRAARDPFGEGELEQLWLDPV
jgi:hypothetical protein